MTQAQYYEDCYQQTFETTVKAANGKLLVLSDTIFYPTGGGQPGDRGTLTTALGQQLAIIDTRKDKDTGEIVHELETADHLLEPGTSVSLQLDWPRRYQHMRMHTAMHLLGSLIPVPVTGGQVGEVKSRLDFDVGEHQLDKEWLTEQMNRLITEGHDLEVGSITEEELDANPGLVRTMSVQPPRGAGVVRTIRVKDVDFQPCGGTHVRNTSEIGPMKVSKIENKGRRNRRVHLVFDEN